MKLSAWVSTSDLLNKKGTGLGEFIFKRFIKQSIFLKNDPKSALLSLKRSGVKGIELLVSSNTRKEDISEIRKMLKELEMKIFSVHQSLSTLFNISTKEIDGLFQTAKELSAEVIVLHISSIGDQIFDRDYVKNLKDLESKYKIKIGIENMPINPLWLFKTYTWREDDFCSTVTKANFHITFDITHLAQTGKDVISFYKKNKSKIANIHLSDYRKNFLNTHLMLTNHTHLPFGDGTLRLEQFLKTLKESRYDGVVTMEINGSLSQLCQSARLIQG